MDFERQKMHKILYFYFFQKKIIEQNIYVPTLPKIFRSLTRNTDIVFIWPRLIPIVRSTVLPAKSDSDIMFCLQSYQGLKIDRSFVY